MDVKVGDVVHVRGTVKSVGASELGDILVSLKCTPLDNFVLVFKSEIVQVERRHFAVGDSVYTANPTVHYVIKAIDCDTAWLWSVQSNAHYTVRLDQLHRAEETR